MSKKILLLDYIMSNEDKYEDGLPMNICEKIKDKLGIPKSTVHNYLKEFVDEGILESEQKDRVTKLKNTIKIVKYWVVKEQKKAVTDMILNAMQ